MHSFLRAVGFSNIKSRKDEDELIAYVIENANEKRIFAVNEDTAYVEMTFEFSERVGITLFGEYDENEKFHLEHYYPFLRGINETTREEVFISKRVDTESYTGMCDDYKVGVSLIFYLQNVIDYMEMKKNGRGYSAAPVIMSALSTEGKILFPVEKSEKQIKISNADNKHRSNLIAEARKGNQEAIENLTIQDIDLYSLISKRAKNEDVYSIVDTSFVPYGSESDNYTILGEIKEVRSIKNSKSSEEMYGLVIECNQLTFEVCINKNDLLGEPEIGRRFKGNVWLQGKVEF